MVRWRLHFDCPEPVWLVAALCVVALAAVLWILWRDVAKAGPGGIRGALLALPALGGALAVGIALNPKITRERPDPKKPRLTLLVDASRSMSLPDSYTGKEARTLADLLGRSVESGALSAQRAEVVRALLRDTGSGWVSKLKDDFDISAWVFSSDVKSLPLKGGKPGYEVDPEGYVTALGDALRETARSEGGERPRAVALLSDGAWNTGRDPTGVALALGRVGTPVFTVGVGDTKAPKDVTVLELKGPKKALVGDELLLRAQVSASGFGAAKLVVQLHCDGRLVAEKPVVAQASGRPVSVNFSYAPVRAGRSVFEARIAPRKDERDEANNTASGAIEITDQKIRALLIDSEPRWEFRFIRSVLDRDPAVQPTVCLLRPRVGPVKGEGFLSKPPADKKALAAFDLVILGDVAVSLLPEAFLKELAEMVRDRGGALAVIAGRRGHYRGLAGTPVGGILPVRVTGGMGRLRGGAPFRVELTQEGSESLVTRLAADPEENELVWSRLTPLRWSAPLGGLRPGATALLAHPYQLAGAGKMPVLAVHRVGLGKALFLGAEETWRWRKCVGDKYHYRFWAQAVRWLVKKQFAEGGRRVRLAIDRAECDAGERVEVEAYCLGPDGYPLGKGRVWAQIEDGKGGLRRVALQPAGGGWGVFRAAFTPERAGDYTLRPIVSAYGKDPLPFSLKLRANRPDLEKNFLAQDRKSLRAIAQDSGGEYLEWSEVGRLPSLLSKRAERRLLTAEYAPCRHWSCYLAMALALSAAWFIRKRSGLA